MFYTKEVKIYKPENTEDKWGAIIEGQYRLVKTAKVDVQPNSRDKLNKEYGYDLETTLRLFCDVSEPITEASLISYRGQPFDVVKIVEWDDYLDIALNDAVGVELHE